MKILGTLLIWFCTISLFAQVSSSPYQTDKIVFKIKSAQYDTQGKLIQQERLPEMNLLMELSAQAPEKRFPKKSAVSPDSRNKQGVRLIDLSRIYTLNLKKEISVEKALKVLKKDVNIEYAEPLYNFSPTAYTPNDPGTNSSNPANNYQWYLDKIDAYEAWDVQKGDPSSIIGIIDYGFRTTHEDLMGNLHPDYYDFGNNDTGLSLPHSYSYHGGAVAGIASATTDNNKGIAGVGFNCRYLPIKAISDNLMYFAWEESLEYLADRNVKVINMSFGRTGSFSHYEDDLMNHYAINKNIVLVSSAGNDGNGGRYWPASYQNVISVAGTNSSDVKWSGSNYNYETNIAAPSQYIRTTYYNCCAYSGTFNNDVSYIPAVSYNMSGTSFASPQVSATAALVATQFPDLSALQIKARIEATADEIDALNPTYAGRLGQGRLNVNRAVTESNVRYISTTDRRFDGFAYVFAGQTAQLTCNFQNWLDATSSLQATLSSTSAYITVTDNTSVLGAVSGDSNVDNTSDAFTIQVDPNTPNNTNVYLRIDYNDGGALNYEYFKIVVNPAYGVLDINKIGLTFGNNGELGIYETCNYCTGISYNDTNLIGNAGLIIGQSSTKTSNTVSVYNAPDPSMKDLNFTVINTFSSVVESDFKEVTVSYEDVTGNANAIGLEVSQRTYAWKDAPDDKYVIIQYYVKNTSGSEISQLQVGLFADWDIGDYTQNKADWDNTRKLGYAYTNSGTYTGVKLLTSQTAHYFAIDNNNIDGLGIDLSDEFSKAEKYLAVSNSLNHTQAGVAGNGNDISHALAAEITNLADGATIVVSFAVLAGDDLADLQSVANQAQTKFLEFNTAAMPDIASSFNVCYNGSLTLSPSNGTDFEFYDEVPPAIPVSMGESLELTNLTESKTFYIIHQAGDKLYDSAPQEVQVNVHPEFTGDFELSTDTLNIFESQTVSFTDISVNRNSSQWSINGEILNGETVSYNFPSEGTYPIVLNVTDNNNCTDEISKNLVVINEVITTGIDQALYKLIQVYPNPAHSILMIKAPFSNYQWSISNYLGNTLLTGTTHNTIENINLESLGKGIYIVEIITPHGSIKKKISVY